MSASEEYDPSRYKSDWKIAKQAKDLVVGEPKYGKENMTFFFKMRDWIDDLDICAIEYGGDELPVIKRVIELLEGNPGFDKATADQYGETLLYYAIRAEFPELSVYLIRNGYETNIISTTEYGRKLGKTPLSLAIRKELVPVVKEITRKMCPSIDILVTLASCSPLYIAVVKGNLEIVKMLLDAGATDDPQGSAFSLALESVDQEETDYYEIVEVLHANVLRQLEHYRNNYNLVINNKRQRS